MGSNIDIHDISKATNDFSFVEQIFNTINNKDFIKNSYANMFGGETVKETEQSYIYCALSAIGQQIMDEIYSHTLNYIDDVSNIDLCKVKALQSCANLLGVDYVIFKSLDNVPLDILNILDIMSLNPTYLIDSKYVKNALANTLTTKFVLSGEIKNSDEISVKLNLDEFDNMLSNIYKNLIETKLNQTYDEDSVELIYQKLSSNIILSAFQLPIEFNDQNNINNLKRKYNIKATFDEKEYADMIDFGISSLEDFSITEQEIIKYEIDRRKKPKYDDKLSTRYAYYKEREVKEYYEFVSYSYQSELTSTTIVGNEYDIDKNYILLSSNTDIENTYNGFLSVNENQTDCILNQAYIDLTVKQLVYLTKQIREIRESLKTQVQKNFMKGAFVLIEHIIKEYLCQLSQQYNSLSGIMPYDAINVDIQEYYDTTEYYNISSNISANDLNVPYWETTKTTKYIMPYNSNNMFELPHITYGSGSGISEIDIKFLYETVLNSKFKTSADIITNDNNDDNTQLNNFLNVIYNSAAEKMYLSNDVIIYFDEENNEKHIPLNTELSSIFEQYKKEIFLKYTENKVGYTPYAYIKNTVHPSYELHPYIRQFIEKNIYDFPIKDIANLVDESLKESIKKNIEKYLDADGFLISAWNNPLNTNDDYQSKYENSSNINELNVVDKVVDYNGLFYPTAIKEFIGNKDKFLSALSNLTCTNEYYSGLNLSRADRKIIADKLNANYTDISCVYKGDYNIEKYIEDQFGTEYFILTKGNDKKIYVKPRNHAIAMPLLSSQFEIDINDISSIKDIAVSYNGKYIILKYDKEFNIYEVAKTYDSSTAITNYILKKSFDTIKTDTDDNSILCINLDTTIVFIFASVKDEDLSIKLKSITPTISDKTIDYSCPIKLEEDIDDINDIYFDATTTGLLTIAYIKDTDINENNRHNCIKNIYSSRNTPKNYNCLQNLIVTHDFKITSRTITSYNDNNVYYNEHTDMGFIPICISSENDVISSDYIVDKYAVYKCEIFGENALCGIDFKFTAPIRSYINNISGYEDLEFLAFDGNTKNESIRPNNIKSKYELKNILNGRYLPLKSDEGYVEDTLIEYPELVEGSCYITHENISKLNNNLIIDLSNTAILKFVNNDRIKKSSLCCNTNNANYNEISVQWSINEDKIQLDFNSYYAKKLSTITSVDNTRNNKHLFLNLAEPGAAGYLNIYSNLNNEDEVHEQVQRYYIKNISDNKPKFILSAEISQNENSFKTYEKNKNYNMLSDDNETVIVFDQPDNVIEYMKVEN